MGAERFFRMNPHQMTTMRYQQTFLKEISQYVLEKLNQKRIFIVTEDEKIQMEFSKNNLLHLLGIEYLGGNQRYWSDYRNNRLILSNMRIQKYTFQKLQAMHALPSLLEKKSRLAQGLIMENTEFDRMLRTNRLVLAIGLEENRQRNIFYPKSALDLKHLDLPKGKDVLAVYTVDKRTEAINILQQKEGFEIPFN